MTTLDQKLAEWIMEKWQANGWPLGNLFLVVIAILLSVALCGVIGIEREWRGRSAGLRTHLLVGVGSCIIMIISIYGFPSLFQEQKDRDIARLAAQIVTGVGFLGAGAIIHKNDGIKGLTTAGTIWIVMAIGIACGSFNFIIATLATLIVMFVLIIFRKIEKKINSRRAILVISTPIDTPVLAKVLSISKDYGCSIKTLANDLLSQNGVNMVQLTLQVVFETGNVQFHELIAKISSEIPGANIRTLNDHS